MREEPEGKISGMEDSVFSDFVIDPSKSSQLSLGEKRELVHQIAQWSKDAPEILKYWTRREILEIICAEMGKKRKYTGFNKYRMIEHLLKLVSKKSKRKNSDDALAFPLAKTQTGCKRQRTRDDHVQFENYKEEKVKILLCQNLACRATLSLEDAFCKRCSCCICHHYDDNKDPSLWLTCSSDPPDENGSCGMSFHLQCALKDERAGIVKSGREAKLDGKFCCVSCGKINCLMRTWRKQLLVAKEARRVDILCLRLSLSHKILKGTEQYKRLQETIEIASEKLKNEVGPLDRVCVDMARGIVNRLTCGAEVQKLCASAVEALDSMSFDLNTDYIHQQKEPPACCIRFEESCPTSVFIVLEYEDQLLKDFLGCRLWHRKSTLKDYPEQPTYIVLKPQKRFKVTDLSPSTKYFCKVSLFSNTNILGVWEAKWVTPTLSGISLVALDEKQGIGDIKVQAHVKMDSTNSSTIKLASGCDSTKLRLLNDIDAIKNKGLHLLSPSVGNVPSPKAATPASVPPSTPCKSDGMREVLSLCCKKEVSKSGYDYGLRVMPSLLRNVSLPKPASPAPFPPSTPCKPDGMREILNLCCKKGVSESDYDFAVRVIKSLESKGLINQDFRVKFLTWFSLKATMQERRVVSAFVDTLIDDPPSLAGQLVDTFMEKICCEQMAAIPRHGFCSRLWH